MKKKIYKALYVLALAVVAFVLAELGLIEPEFAMSDMGYPVDIQQAGDTVSIISTGQADSALICSDGKYALIDCGQTETGHSEVIQYLKNAGVEQIEVMVLTHFHRDHTSQLAQVLNNFKVKTVVIPKLTKENTPTAKYFTDFLDKVEKEKIKLKSAKKGDSYKVGSGSIKILADTYNDLDTNNTSVATLFTQGDFTFLNTGDGEAVYEQRLLEDFSGRVNLFAAGHHGSSTSNTSEFIGAIHPDFIAISAGKDNEYGHPHREVVQLFEGMQIPYRVTAETGTIVYSINDRCLLTD